MTKDEEREDGNKQREKSELAAIMEDAFSQDFFGDIDRKSVV